MGKHFKNQDQKKTSKRPALTALIIAALVIGGLFAFLQFSGEKKPVPVSQPERPAAESPTAPAKTPALSKDETAGTVYNGTLSSDIMKDKINELISADAKKTGKSAKQEIAPSAPYTKDKTYNFDPPLLAVIIDDGGNNMELAGRAAALDIPLTWAIMPYQRHSGETAAAARSGNIPFLVHLPMQAIVDKTDSEYLIGDGMSGEQIKKICADALDSLNGAVGINNHRGSKATSNKEIMEYVVGAVRDRGLAFIDSRTSSSSVAYNTALEMGVPALKNNGFLDNTPDKNAIAAQFKKAEKTAERRGAAVVICHFRPATMAFLEDLSKNKGSLRVKLVTIPQMLAEIGAK